MNQETAKKSETAKPAEVAISAEGVSKTFCILARNARQNDFVGLASRSEQAGPMRKFHLCGGGAFANAY